MSLTTDKPAFRMKMRDVENAFKYRRIPYPKRSIELIALLAISCTFFLFMHTNKLNSRLKEMEVKLQPSEFSALGLTGDNHISSRDTGGRQNDINTLHGTYQYLKSTGQILSLKPDNLNNTQKSEVDIVFFNRVPKVGSETMMRLLQLLAKENNFEATRDKTSYIETILISESYELELVSEIMEKKEPATYTKHVAYIDFELTQYPYPIYINLVRDPIERLISWFYYIRAPWYLAARAKNFPESYKVPKIPWLKKDFDSCILKHDPECIFRPGELTGLADHRRQMLFFCGQDTETCMPFNSYDAMQVAKRHVEEQYAVVGTWEDTNVTLSVFEHYIPRFFKGATDIYFKPENNLHKVNRNSIKPAVSQKVRDILSKNLTNEIEFYRFCKQRLYKQFIAVNLQYFNET